MFKTQPALFMERSVVNDRIDAFYNQIALMESVQKKLFVYYSLGNLIELFFSNFVVILLVASFSIMLSVYLTSLSSGLLQVLLLYY